MFEAFRERDYRAFWTTQFLSNIGSWMQTIAQGWLVYRLTDSPFLLGFVGFAGSIPSFFLMLPGGVAADHFDRRRVVSASQWAQALSALFLAVAIRTGQISVWQIVAASLVVGVAISFSAPAYQAMIIDLLDERGRLPNAVAMNSLQFNLSRVVGPLIAGLTLAAWGPFWCFFFNALSFLPLIWVLGRVTKRQRPAESTARLWARMTEGFTFVRRERKVLLPLLIVSAASLFGFPYVTLMPMMARTLYPLDDARGLGLLMGGIGAGALAGSAAISASTPRRALPIIYSCIAVLGLGLMALAFVRARATVIPVLAVCGATMVVGAALCNTSIQKYIPDGMRGRVLSMYTFAFFGFLPFGNLFAGIIAEHGGFAPTMLTMGGGLIAAVALAVLSVRAPRDPAAA